MHFLYRSLIDHGTTSWWEKALQTKVESHSNQSLLNLALLAYSTAWKAPMNSVKRAFWTPRNAKKLLTYYPLIPLKIPPQVDKPGLPLAAPSVLTYDLGKLRQLPYLLFVLSRFAQPSCSVENFQNLQINDRVVHRKLWVLSRSSHNINNGLNSPQKTNAILKYSMVSHMPDHPDNPNNHILTNQPN